MSLDRSLRTGGDLIAKRSVFKRHERLALLKEHRDFDAKKKGVLHLPKTNVRGL